MIEHFIFVKQRDDSRYWKGVERLYFDKDRHKRREYRFCYWAKLSKSKPWRWGQFAPAIPTTTLREILRLMDKKGWP